VQGGLDQAPGAEFGKPMADPDPAFQGRVGQQEAAPDVEQDRGMTQPCDGELGVEPGVWIGSVWC